MKSKTIRFHEFGGPEVLRFESLEPGTPGDGEVLVRIAQSLDHSAEVASPATAINGASRIGTAKRSRPRARA
ncbi:MAG: hypothetical protein IT473_15195 [Lysobacter sp.]|nr:hypothetical protein [Lysobacter sp.]